MNIDTFRTECKILHKEKIERVINNDWNSGDEYAFNKKFNAIADQAASYGLDKGDDLRNYANLALAHAFSEVTGF